MDPEQDKSNRAAEYGAIGSLIRSIGSSSMDTPHTGTMGEYKAIKKIPHAAISMEDAMMISRIYHRGQKVVVKLNMEELVVEPSPRAVA